MRAKNIVRNAACAAAVAALTAGCLSEGGSEGTDSGSGGDGTVEIMYGFSQDQSDLFQESLNAFAESEGITVQYSPTPDFDKLVRSRVAGNNLPDIAIFPQPGITLDIARSGKLADLRDVLDVPALEESLVAGFLDAATAEDGAVYASPIVMSVKSLVWYPRGPFEEAGYEIPESHEELLALTEQIKADGVTPWCIGIGSDAATGWPATDWMEDYVLRFGGTEVYDQWVNHEIPFNDPVIQQAGEAMEEIWFPEGNVLGGRSAIASTFFGTAGNPMFSDPPGCMLHRQASFLAQPGSFPEDVVTDLDSRAGIFPLPPINAGDGQSVMGGGDLAGLFSQDDEDSIKILEFITSSEFGSPWVDSGGFLSPHTTFDTSLYINETWRQIAEIAYSATEFRFDGSDLMPGEVGAGSFWRGMVSWVTGDQTMSEALDAIEESWPAE